MVAVAAVLAAVAVPNMSEFIKNNARATRLNDLVTAINYARNNAVTQRNDTKICASLNGTSCSGSQFKAATLVMMFDPVTAAWVRMRTFNGNASGNFTLTGDAAEIIYKSTGLASTTVANVKFVHCDDRGADHARAVVLSASGQPRISSDNNGDGIDDVKSTNLTCS